MLQLIETKRSDERLMERMKAHYSQPKGFVGRTICYAIDYNGVYYGHIVAGSATRYLPGRNEALGIELSQLNNVINNIFFNIQKVNGRYPTRNFTKKVVTQFMIQARADWEARYGDRVVGFETLVELPRSGELYQRAGFVEVGTTKGYTCRRIPGPPTDGFGGARGGKRVWNTDPDQLRPKMVLCKPCEG